MVKIVEKKYLLPKKEFMIKHFQIINTLGDFQLTNKEIEVIATFLSLDTKIIEEDVFNVTARKLVLEHLNISQASLSNYLKTLIDKKFIIRNEITGNIKMNETIVPTMPIQGYKIKLELKDDSRE